MKKHLLLCYVSLASIAFLSCGDYQQFPVLSGKISLCNNHNCWKRLDARLNITNERLPREHHREDLYDWANSKRYWKSDPDTVRKNLVKWLVGQVRDSLENNKSYLSEFGILIGPSFSCDTSQLCGECAQMYRRYNIPINTSPESVNLAKAGFKSEAEAKLALGRFLGFRNIQWTTGMSENERCCLHACAEGVSAICVFGLGINEAKQKVLRSFKEWKQYYAQQRDRESASSRRTSEWLSKNPDEMSDKEWYDQMEALSNDPTWKDVVREQRKAKGID